MQKPNLIIAGAQKSGTTWLHRALKMHDDFFMSDLKELNFFNNVKRFHSPEAIQQYFDNFSDAGSQKYVGEATPHYMWVRKNTKAFNPLSDPETTAAFIKKLLPETHIIAVLRDPASRAISAFHHHFAMGRLNATSQINSVDPHHGVIDMGHYARHIDYWHDVFGDRLHVYLYDELKNNNTGFLAQLFKDLDVADDSQDIASQLASQRINSKQKIISRNEERSSSEFPRVSLQQIENLIEDYEADMQYLESYLSVNLDHWRDAEAIERSVVYR